MRAMVLNSSAFYGDGTKPFPSGQEYKQFVVTKLRSYISTGNAGNLIALLLSRIADNRFCSEKAKRATSSSSSDLHINWWH